MSKVMTCWGFMKRCGFVLASVFAILFIISNVFLCISASQYCGIIISLTYWFAIWPTIFLVSIIFYPITLISPLIIGPVAITIGYAIAGIIQTYIIGLM